MEHRWGQRVPLRLDVSLKVEPAGLLHGRTRDVSLSGAFVSMPLPQQLALWTRVRVQLEGVRRADGRPRKFSAFVARRAPDGIALEWRAFAPPAIRRLIAAKSIERRGSHAPRELLAHSDQMHWPARFRPE
jgi:hypothetical protein